MNSTIKKQGDTAISELAKTYEVVRDELQDRIDSLAGRIDEFDTQKLGKRAYATSRELRKAVESRASRIEQRVRPRPRRRLPFGLLAAAGLAGVAAYVLYDRRRRDAIRGRITQLGATAGERVPNSVKSSVDDVMTRVKGSPSAVEQKLRSDVEAAITGAGEGGTLPAGLLMAVEGRTVYLRGTVEPSVADQAASRAQTVPGVAAVVNLTSASQPAAANGRGKPVTGRPAVPGTDV